MNNKKHNPKRRAQRGLALLLSLVMCLGMIQTTAFAAEDEATQPEGPAALAFDSEGQVYTAEFIPEGSQDQDQQVQQDQGSTEDDQEALLPPPVAPDGFTQGEDGRYANTPEDILDANGNKIGEKKSFWESEDVTNGYKTTETTVTETTVVTDNDESADRPEDAADVEGGYTYTRTETLEDGTVRTTKYTVANGQTTKWTQETKTTETVKTATKTPGDPQNPVEDATPGQPVDVIATPDKPGEGTFEADLNEVLPEPTAPEGYTQGEDGGYANTPSDILDANGDKIGEEKSFWKTEKLPADQGYGYKTTTTTIKETTVVRDNEPADRPEDAADIEGGYTYTRTETLEDGTVRATTYTVMNGQTTERIRETKTTETVQVAERTEDGKITLTVSKADGTVETIEVDPEWVNPDGSLKPGYDKHGYDKNNDLYDRDGAKKLMTVKVDNPNETGGFTRVWTIGQSSKDNKNIVTGQHSNGQLKKGTELYVYEMKTLRDGRVVYKIDKEKNAWVFATDVDRVSATYKVTTNTGFVYSDHDASGKAPASRGNGSYVLVDEWYTDEKGVKWCHINSDGNMAGWIKESNLKLQLNPPEEMTLAKPEYMEDRFHEEGYDYYYLGETGMESSIRVKIKDSTGDWMAHQFILRDKKLNKYYVYCVELGTDPKSGYDYKLIPLEDVVTETGETLTPEQMENYVGHLNTDDLQQIRAVAQNGYWGAADGNGEGDLGSLLALKTKLKAAYPDISADVLNAITPGMALTATQAALWYYGNTNGKEVNTDTDRWLQYLGAYYSVQGNKGYAHNFSTLNPTDKKALGLVFGWLTGLDEDGPKAEAPEVITKENFQVTEATVTVQGVVDNSIAADSERESVVDQVIYNTDVSFALEVTANSDNDDLIVLVYVNGSSTPVAACPLNGRGEISEENKALLGENWKAQYELRFENGKYSIKGIQLPNDATLDINLKGTQDLGKGVYIFKSQAKEDETSQTFIGLSESNAKQKVDLKVTLDFDVEAAKATITTTETITEVRESWNNSDGSSTFAAEDVKMDSHRDPDPTPDPDPDPTPDPDPDPDPTPDPDPEDPTPTTPEEPTADITEDPTPLAEPEVPEVPETPEELVEIPEPDVPLADVPRTGDSSSLWYAMSLLAVCGLAVLRVLRGKDEETAE